MIYPYAACTYHSGVLTGLDCVACKIDEVRAGMLKIAAELVRDVGPDDP